MGEQYLKGSPVYEGKQVQVGVCDTTWQTAFDAHVPGHGSIHLLFKQAFVGEQSVLTIHSGRHPSYGFPKYSGRQVQDPAPFCSLQIAFAPQGLGIHGDKCSIGLSSTEK